MFTKFGAKVRILFVNTKEKRHFFAFGGEKLTI